MDMQHQASVAILVEQLREKIKVDMPNNPLLSGWSTYAQFDEDGIINHCLTHIAKVQDLSRTFIEIGCGNGLENNTHQLLLDGYRGVWVDGNAQHITSIANQLGGLQFERLLVQESRVTLDNIVALIEQAARFLSNRNVDFLSCDIDGNDIHFVQAILTVLQPKLICVEYNAKFVPPIRLAMAYHEKHEWAGDDYFGVSLQSWVDVLEQYTLVCCNLSGVNAFFIRNDLLGDQQLYPVEQLFQPCRYYLTQDNKGHACSLKWLKQVLLGK
ncbi:MAG: hypothetical protein NTW08_00515 [Gammaproteobacteria bacterium]|nr:hypothetical protein [Gammaproteobacteria bacterium]